jgi:DNA uptake protein ComE-like DNA-binding protein
MQHRFISLALSAAVVLLVSSASLAADTSKAKAAPQAASQASASSQAAKPKLVDINSASKAELKKLPGITDADAAKIIAGRPYGSKAHLVTRNIIDSAVYEKLKQQIVARQP